MHITHLVNTELFTRTSYHTEISVFSASSSPESPNFRRSERSYTFNHGLSSEPDSAGYGLSTAWKLSLSFNASPPSTAVNDTSELDRCL